MGKWKTILTALVAVFAVSALTAASASAAAHFEAKGGFPVKFTAAGGPGYLETVTDNTTVCKHSTAEGEVASATEMRKLTVKFFGCTAEVPVGHVAVIPTPCHSLSPSGGKEEIITKPITAKPIDLEHGGAGVVLTPETTGTLFAEYACESGEPLTPANVKVQGSIIGQVPGAYVNVFTPTMPLEFKATAGLPEPLVAEGGAHYLEASIDGLPFEPSGIQEYEPGSTVTTALEGKEIKLVP